MKKIGTYNGVPVYEESSIPPGQLYFLNNSYTEFYRVKNAIYEKKPSYLLRLKWWLTKIFKRTK